MAKMEPSTEKGAWSACTVAVQPRICLMRSYDERHQATKAMCYALEASAGTHEQGLIITTSDFSPGAVKEAAHHDKTPIALMNGHQIVVLLMEDGIGVHRSTPDLFEIDEEFASPNMQQRNSHVE